jgi:hypothetical protein
MLGTAAVSANRGFERTASRSTRHGEPGSSNYGPRLGTSSGCCDYETGGGATGSSNVNVEPTPGSESTLIRPFIRRTSSRQM